MVRLITTLFIYCAFIQQIYGAATTRIPVARKTTLGLARDAVTEPPKTTTADDQDNNDDSLKIVVQKESDHNVRLPLNSKKIAPPQDQDVVFTQENAGCRLVDLALVVDSSGSILDKGEDNWNITRQFLRTLIDVLPVGLNQTRVGLVKFATDARVWFNLNSYDSKVDLQNFLSVLRYGGGWTNTHKALNLMRTQVFQEENGDRSDYVNVAVVLTDGESTILPQNTIPEALRAKAEGVQIFVVGVTNKVNKTEARAIASKDEWAYYVEDFVDLAGLAVRLRFDICRITNERLTALWADWTSWSSCSVTCGSGVVTRTRTCRGTNCEGSGSEDKSCEVDVMCPEWTEWGPCSASCGGGRRARTRGSDLQFGECLSQSCPEWTAWGTCDVTCGSGRRARTRGTELEFGECLLDECPEWTAWGPCDVTCGRGRRARTRGTELEFGECESDECPEWTAWGPCDVTCGQGRRARTRETELEFGECESDECPDGRR